MGRRLQLERVIPRLQTAGLHVTAVQSPLTSIEDSVAEARRVLALQDGPTVLVAHSWSGTIISEIGADPKGLPSMRTHRQNLRPAGLEAVRERCYLWSHRVRPSGWFVFSHVSSKQFRDFFGICRLDEVVVKPGLLPPVLVA
jgi:hypothetical protein